MKLTEHIEAINNHQLKNLKNFFKIRFKIDQKILDDIASTLTDKGFYLKDIEEEMGNTSSRQVFYAHALFSKENFDMFKENVVSKLGKECLRRIWEKHSPSDLNDFNQKIIPFELCLGRQKSFLIEKNEKTAEFTGILLGDGHLGEDGKEVSITLNNEDEPRYVNYVKKEIVDDIFGPEFFHIKPRKGEKYCHIQSGHRSIHFSVEELVKGVSKKGLVPGDKITNQVNLPEWIFSKDIFLKKALKGLIDTDGSFIVNHSNIVAKFVNASEPLINDFYDLCKSIGISTSKSIRKMKNSIAWAIDISASDDVNRFIDLIDPEKIKEPMRRLYLALRVMFRDLPYKNRVNIEFQIENWKKEKGKKKFGYTKENTLLLKDWIIQEIRSAFSLNNFDISDGLIEEAIRVGRNLHSYKGLRITPSGEIIGFPKTLVKEIMAKIIEQIDKVCTLNFSDLLEYMKIHIFGSFTFSIYSKQTIFLEQYLSEILIIISEYVKRVKNGDKIVIREIYKTLKLELPFATFRDILSYLRDEYYGDTLSEYLLRAYNIMLKKGKNEISTVELSNALGHNAVAVRKKLHHGIEENYFATIFKSKGAKLPNIYILTDKGLEKAHFILEFVSKLKKYE